MRKTIFSLTILAVALLCASCEEDRDSNPTYREDSVLVLNTPAGATNNVYDLTSSDGTITLTTSQPDNGIPLATTYQAQISLDGENFTDFGETAERPELPLSASSLNTKVIELNGGECPEGVTDLYVRVRSYLTVDNTLGNAVSNVITLKVLPYAPTITATLPETMYIVGGFAASGGDWSKFVALHPAYDKEGLFYGVIYMEATNEFKLTLKDSWSDEVNYDMAAFGDDFTSGLLSKGDGTNFKVGTTGWYTVLLQAKLSGNDVNYTLTFREANVYVIGNAVSGVWEWNDNNKFTAPSDANGEWVSPAFTSAGEIRVAIDCGIDYWWRTELTLDGSNNIYYRDFNLMDSWTEKGADYSKTGVAGGHIYLNFTDGTGRVTTD